MISVLTFQVTQPIRRRYMNVTDGRTDRQHTLAIARCIER